MPLRISFSRTYTVFNIDEYRLMRINVTGNRKMFDDIVHN